MTKDVLLSLKGLQTEQGSDEQPLETITPAQYFERAGSRYVIYDEAMEGFSNPTKNVFKFNDSVLEVTKRGLVNVHMVFEEKKKNMTSYATPYGSVMIGIDTEKVSIREEEDRIRVDVTYTLEANYQFMADCKIEMDICPKQMGLSCFEKQV